MPKSKSMTRKSIILGTQEFFTCFECGKSFRNRIGMRLHNKTTHGLNREDTTNINYYYCAQCDNHFDNQFKLNYHIVNFHKGCWKAAAPQK